MKMKTIARSKSSSEKGDEPSQDEENEDIYEQESFLPTNAAIVASMGS